MKIYLVGARHCCETIDIEFAFDNEKAAEECLENERYCDRIQEIEVINKYVPKPKLIEEEIKKEEIGGGDGSSIS